MLVTHLTSARGRRQRTLRRCGVDKLVTGPQLRSALLAGGLLTFALCFDEIIVTTFTIGVGDTTLPIWIL